MAWIRVWDAHPRVSPLKLYLLRTAYNSYRPLATESTVNHYDVLGLRPSASPSQIKSAYYKLSKKYHPDVAVGVTDAKEKFSRLSMAYEVLSNPGKRAEYDRTLSVVRHTTYPYGSDIDVEYREFLRRRGSFHQRPTGGHASPGTAGTFGGRSRIDYDEFFRHQQQTYGSTYRDTMREKWESQKNFEQKLRHEQAVNMQTFWLFFALGLGLMFGIASGK